MRRSSNLEPAMDRRQLLAATLAPLVLRAVPDGLSSTAFAAASERDGKMSAPDATHHRSNNIHINIAEQGSGPLVLLCHGFPECWYSWRHRSPRSPKLVSMPSRPTCAATARATRRRQSTNTPSSIWSGTSSACSMRSSAKTRGRRRPRRGRERGVAGRTNAPRSRPRRRWAQRAVPAAREGAADERHAAD